MVWADGERELWWSRAAALDHGLEQPDWVTAATGANRLSELTPMQVSWLFSKGPGASARARLATPLLLRIRQRLDVNRVAVARFELDAPPLALSEAGESAEQPGLLMLPFRGPEAALMVAGWLRQLGSARLWGAAVAVSACRGRGVCADPGRGQAPGHTRSSKALAPRPGRRPPRTRCPARR